ncbi:MAG: acetyl-CoA carboxylase biotin carboxyl carrier protein [Alphaproteobacteria bacterium]|nr:acetyl-CoA carboxylase biotin carboxyl carrier protein [Alphaproteobacteria bacterium]
MARFEVDSDLVLKLASLLREAGLGEIEYESEGRRIRVALPHVAAGTTVVHSHSGAPESAPAKSETAPVVADHSGAIPSPMVGTVYLSTGPGEPAFVAVGQAVLAGQTVLLIEAMKTFNEVKAHRSGTLARMLVSNGQAVEYGELLAIIE